MATSGVAVREATTIDLGGLITLGPGEPAFTDLIDIADHELAEDVFQSGAVEDPTSLTAYDLYAFEAEMTESDGKRSSVWATLVKVDDGGNARAVRWETLANLVPGPGPRQPTHTQPVYRPPRAPPPRSRTRPSASTGRFASEWFAQARKDLTNLPLALTDAIEDRDERIALRKTLQEQTCSEARAAGAARSGRAHACRSSSDVYAFCQRPRPSSPKTRSPSGWR